MNIRCVVACTNASGGPGFFGCEMNVTTAQYDNGDHYDLAIVRAKDADYEGPHFVVFDENDGPEWLFERIFQTGT